MAASATQRVLVIIPAYNEAQSLPALIGRIRSLYPQFDVLVIDDGSTDTTGTVSDSLSMRAGKRRAVRAISLPCNLGVGGAVQTGLLYALEENYDVAIQVDGDGQHPPEEIAKLLAAMEQSRSDLVIGSRFLKTGDIAAAYHQARGRRVGTRFFSSILSALCRTRITDATSGFRAFGRRAIEVLAHRYPEDYPEVEAILMLSQARLRVSEVAVRMAERTAGTSSIGSWEAVTFMVKVPLAILMSLLRRHDEIPH